MARDQGQPGRYTGGRGHQTLKLQGATDDMSRGHAEHDRRHGRPTPKLGPIMKAAAGAPRRSGPVRRTKNLGRPDITKGTPYA